MQYKLFIVTFYHEDNGNEWDIVVAKDYDDAINQVKKDIMDMLELKDDDELASNGMADFQAYEQSQVGKHKIILEEVKNENNNN